MPACCAPFCADRHKRLARALELHDQRGSVEAHGVPRAAEVAQHFVEPLGRRWQHVQAVAARAEELRFAASPEDCDVLVAAAWLHDIGYSLELDHTRSGAISAFEAENALTERTAQRALENACQQAGLDADGAELIRIGSNAVMTWPGYPVFAECREVVMAL